MSQDRLDKSCSLPVGTRDAIHVPYVVATCTATIEQQQEHKFKIPPGSYVRFTDENCTKFILCARDEAQGIVNPFLTEILFWHPVVVLVMPGITTPVRHIFNINPAMQRWEQQVLEKELAEVKAQDPDCAECWHIRNNEIIRD
jgi:hypothetical protein